MNPRLAAWRVLQALEGGQRHLQGLLDQELSRHRKAPARDRAQAFNLVYSVLRNRLLLEHRLAPFLKTPLDKLDPPVACLLRLGAAELTVLGVAPHAAVHAAVALAKGGPARRAQGLVNAVLRALADGWQQVALPDAATEPAAQLAVAFSHPPWLVERLLQGHGPDKTRAWLEANQQPASLCLRANTLRISRDDLAGRLADQGLAARANSLSPEALCLERAGGPAQDLPGFSQGLWQAQDPASQAMAHLLGAGPGMAVADLCAGAGGKTGHLAALMNNQGRILALDTSPGRLQALGKNLARLGVEIVQARQADASKLELSQGPFERILLDAPCTGLGTLGRRPDIRWRVGPEDPARLARLQAALLARAADLLAPGGALLYCTCTITEEENQQAVTALLAARPDLRLEWDLQAAGGLAERIDSQGFFATQPHRDLCDAFFAARLVKQGP